jgi:glycosyltransferase involved in cell wall biosynthesis
VREKGYREVFAAAELLRRRGVHVRWLVAGPRDESKPDAVGDESLAAAADAGVLFLGHRDDVQDVYAASDLFVLASYREGLPQAAMEAAAMALPVVATDVRGCRQVVDHDRSGLLVPARDADALAAAVASLSGSTERRSAMGAAARAKAVSEFDEEATIRQVLSQYAALLGGAGG